MTRVPNAPRSLIVTLFLGFYSCGTGLGGLSQLRFDTWLALSLLLVSVATGLAVYGIRTQQSWLPRAYLGVGIAIGPLAIYMATRVTNVSRVEAVATVGAGWLLWFTLWALTARWHARRLTAV
jgi:hypothetical protein